MEIKVTKNQIHLDDKSKLNENEYNINNIDFTFSEEYTQELVKIALFSANNTNYKEIITQNQCKIPSEILANEGVFVLGVYAYSTEDVYKLTEDTEIDEDKTYYTRTGSGTEEEPYEYTEVENPIAENLSTYYEKNVKLSLRYSPSPIKLVVDSGSYIPDEQTQNSEPITASELEQYQQALNDGLREAENVNISAEKVDKVATITIIDRYGDETSVEIQDGTDGIDGKDAKINGVNTLTIKAGQNIEIEQEENTLIINGQSNYNNLTNKPKINNVELTGNKTTSDLGIVIPDVSGFITKDVNNLTNYTLKTNTGSLIDLEINQSTYVVTLKLKDIDGNVISTDTIDLPLESVVVGGSYDATNKKIVLTLENGNTVDIPVGDLIAGLQTEITSQNKLASDLVDDSNSGNKFVNTSEKNSWNAKYDKPNGGIPKTDLANAVQTSLDKADTAVQDVSDKEDISNKVTEIDENSTDTEYPSAKLLYNKLAEKQEQIDGLVTENALLKDQIPNGTAEGTNVQITDSSNLPIEDGMLKGNTEQDGEPTPDTPQEIKVVTGDCEVEVVTDDNPTYTSHAHQTFPISLGTIELCKIGDYQDYLFKNTRTLRSGRANPLFNPDLDEGDWYKHKVINKVVLDGSHSGLRAPSSTSGNYRMTVDIGTNIISGDANLTAPIYSDKFIGINRIQSYAEVQGIAPTDPSFTYKSLVIYCDATKNMTYAEFQTWLSTNNVLVYYVLATPTYIKITDTALIAQLEAYYNSSTYRNVTNIITAGEDLPPIASIVYKKDLTTLFNKLDSLEARVDLLE